MDSSYAKQVKVFLMQATLGIIPRGLHAFGLFLLFAASVLGGLPGEDGEPPIPVIDMHTHVFNARDLPLAGIISAYTLNNGIAQVIAEAILQLTEADDLYPERGFSPEKARFSSDELILEEDQRENLMEFTGYVPAVAVDAKSRKAQNESDLELVARALQKVGFPLDHDTAPSDDKAVELLRGPGDATLGGLLQFLKIMRQSNVGLAHTLLDTYPKTDLFVHHMMDMERAYADLPYHDFETQVRRMPKLNSGFEGKLLHFVAFDPFRRDTSLEYVRMATNFAAVGVKFYPPSGYSASGNSIIPKPRSFNFTARRRWNSRYADLTPEALDSTISNLLAFCTTSRLPVFTHCTPKGFQAHREAGTNSHPRFWRSALVANPNLFLCFGHAGGRDYWFGTETNEASRYGQQVVELCLEYPNVYCEIGYLAEALKPEQFTALTNRLTALVGLKSAVGNWTFGDKIMYGTDWHMMVKVDDHERYVEAWDRVFQSSAALKPYRRRFFSANAVKFLRLVDLINNPQFARYKEKWGKLIKEAQWTKPPEIE